VLDLERYYTPIRLCSIRMVAHLQEDFISKSKRYYMYIYLWSTTERICI